MSERKAWLENEDKVLKQLYQVRNLKKWAEISRVMQNEFTIDGRTGKQCRERYLNYLDSSIKHQKWTQNEELDLIGIQQRVGNRWAQISRLLKIKQQTNVIRSQNDIKNQFYSIIRRGLRKINTSIRLKIKRVKCIPLQNIYLIFQHCQNNEVSNYMTEYNQIKKTILRYAFINQPNYEEKQIKMIQQMANKVKLFAKTKPNMTYQKLKMNKLKSQRQQSEQIQSAELRDDFLVKQMKIEAVQYQIQKDPLHIITQQIEVAQQVGKTTFPLKVRQRSSFGSNASYEGTNSNMHQDSRLFQMQSDIYTSPRPIIFAASPYFDQYKNNFMSWTQFGS